MAKHPDSLVLRYLRSIDAKLDRLNKRLDRSLSAPKGKRAARRTGDADEPAETFVAGTPERAEELRKKYPHATIIMTGVPRANDVIGETKSRTKSRSRQKAV